jgi:hypothetical protein
MPIAFVSAIIELAFNPKAIRLLSADSQIARIFTACFHSFTSTTEPGDRLALEPEKQQRLFALWDSLDCSTLLSGTYYAREVNDIIDRRLSFQSSIEKICHSEGTRPKIVFRKCFRTQIAKYFCVSEGNCLKWKKIVSLQRESCFYYTNVACGRKG